MKEEILIKVDNVSRYFGEHCAVREISFTVKRGEILGFLGPNGAGKTTSMQIICGVIAASEGSVSIAGHDILAESRQAKMHLGFLPEHPPLYLDLTVDEYLRFCARLHDVESSKIATAVANTKQRCGLHDVGGRIIGNLSKGYQQRVGIAQAIIHTPAVVILDEPTSGLDPNQIIEIRSLICELGEDHSVILSTHVLSEVQSTCNRVLIINNGRLVLDEDLGALNKDTRQQYCIVALQNAPTAEELASIEGIANVECLDKQRFRIAYRQHQKTPAMIATAAVQNGWGLYELIPETDTLENIFIQLTRDDGIVEQQA